MGCILVDRRGAEQKVDTRSIFNTVNVGPYQLGNRLVSLPLYTGYAHTDGRVSSLMIEHYTRLANSGVAMVVVANAAVASDGVVSGHNLRIDRDEFIPGLSKLAAAIKGSGAKACLQLNHAGRFANTERPLLPSPMEKSNFAFNVASLKNFMNFFPLEKRFGLTRYLLRQLNTWRQAMTTEDLERIIISFGEAASRAVEAKFDMVELHGAGGYLLCQFLSLFSNKIQSDFGGDFEGRTAFPLDVIREIKERLPRGFPIGFRLIIREWVPDGIDPSEAISFARLLEGEGIAYLSASVASYNSMFSQPALKEMAKPAYLRKDMAKLTGSVNIPTIISGRINKPALAEKMIREGSADLIGLGRSLRTDIHWPTKARGRSREITTCINCNWCLKRVVLDQGFICRRWPSSLQERTELELKLLSRNFKGLFVVPDVNDLKLFQASLPWLLPEKRSVSVAISPTILFLKSEEQDEALDRARRDFLDEARGVLNHLGFTDGTVKEEVRIPRLPYDAEVHLQAGLGNHGLIFICRNRKQAWRERLLYKERGRVMALVGSKDRKSEVLVPVDLSASTLLILMFLRQTYIHKPGLHLHFVHVRTGPAGPIEQRWKAAKKIVGLEEDFPLQLIPSKGDVAADLLEMIKAGDYGTIIMGKRGLSRIKRWLLGSVSSGVLRGLRDQTLFLID